MKKAAVLYLCVGALIMLTGCKHLGPRTVAMDRFDYSTAIADSWKQQTLLNIVKFRYADLPVFVDVASIVNGYSMETSVNVGGQISSSGGVAGNNVIVGGAGRFTDRPTITYVPMTGEKFLHGFITPIDPKNIFFMLQAGYPADFILGLTVESLNGVRNRSTAGGILREADADFLKALELLSDIQAAGAFGMRVEKDENAVVFFRREDVHPDVLEKAATIRRLLKMPPNEQRFTLTYSPSRGADNELSVNSRSMLQIMAAFASHLDVPEVHLKEQRALPGFDRTTDGAGDPVRIHSGKEQPKDAYAAVPYRGHWFWIDDGDWKTKRALTAVMFFFTLAETSEDGKLPLITVPAQ